MEKILLTQEEVLEFLGGISLSTLRKWHERGLPTVVLDVDSERRHVRYPKDLVKEWVHRQAKVNQ